MVIMMMMMVIKKRFTAFNTSPSFSFHDRDVFPGHREAVVVVSYIIHLSKDLSYIIHLSKDLSYIIHLQKKICQLSSQFEKDLYSNLIIIVLQKLNHFHRQ